MLFRLHNVVIYNMDYELRGVKVVLRPSATGKTVLAKVLRYVLCPDPDLAKELRTSPDSMVEVVMDDGKTIPFRLSKHDEGKGILDLGNEYLEEIVADVVAIHEAESLRRFAGYPQISSDVVRKIISYINPKPIEIQRLKDELSSIKEQIKSFDTQIYDLVVTKRDNTLKHIDELKKRLEAVNKRINDLIKKYRIDNELVSKVFQYHAGLMRVRDELREVEKELRERSEELSSVEAELGRHAGIEEGLKEELNTLSRKIGNLEAKIKLYDKLIDGLKTLGEALKKISQVIDLAIESNVYITNEPLTPELLDTLTNNTLMSLEAAIGFRKSAEDELSKALYVVDNLNKDEEDYIPDTLHNRLKAEQSFTSYFTRAGTEKK